MRLARPGSSRDRSRSCSSRRRRRRRFRRASSAVANALSFQSSRIAAPPTDRPDLRTYQTAGGFDMRARRQRITSAFAGKNLASSGQACEGIEVCRVRARRAGPKRSALSDSALARRAGTGGAGDRSLARRAADRDGRARAAGRACTCRSRRGSRSARARAGAPFVLGIAGAQGTGKSTLAALVSLLLDVAFDRARGRALARRRLSHARASAKSSRARVHPLLVTRGVPGTHDLELGARVLDALCAARAGELVRCPRFDKAHDDRAPEAGMAELVGPDRRRAARRLVRGRDRRSRGGAGAADQRARARAGSRRALPALCRCAAARPVSRAFSRACDALLFLAAPDLGSVRRWRREQEHKLAARAGARARGVMSDAQLEHFVQHFERVSRHMLRELPGARGRGALARRRSPGRGGARSVTRRSG